MDIGQKLKNARLTAKMTQESVAEQIGVSRQTISTWENNKSYPDIMNVLALSDLYALSLDELLKGDQKMLAHLETTTDVVKTKQRLSQSILTAVYLLIWALSIIVFWLGGKQDAMGYSLVTFYLVLPVTTLILSFFIGKDTSWGRTKWLMPLFFGVMNMLAPYATFSLANMLAFDKLNLPAPTDLLAGFIYALVGLALGTWLRLLKARHR